MSKYIRIGVSAVLLLFIAWRTDWAVVGEKFANLNVWPWLGAVGVLIFAQIASARRWQLFAQELRFQRSLVQYALRFIGMVQSVVALARWAAALLRLVSR